MPNPAIATIREKIMNENLWRRRSDRVETIMLNTSAAKYGAMESSWVLIAE